VHARKVHHDLYSSRIFRRIVAQVQRADIFILILLISGNSAPSAMNFDLPAAAPVLATWFRAIRRCFINFF
jgi:hypothetical protein